MRHGERQIFEDDPVFEESDMSDTRAAYLCGLKEIKFLGVWTRGTNLAYMRGRAARNKQPIIDLLGDTRLTTKQPINA